MSGGGILAERARRVTPTIVSFILLTFLLEQAGWLKGFESKALDTLVSLREPLEAQQVVIVGISRDDYRTEFGERSPLDPAKLKRIVDAIAKGHPAVIGVDLDTGAEVFRDLQPPPAPPTIVWARDASAANGDSEAGAAERSQGRNQKSIADIGKRLLHRFLPFIFRERERIVPGGVLGRDRSSFPSGVALIPRDNDGAIRRYRRQFRTSEPGSALMDSFSWAIVKEYDKAMSLPLRETEESDEGWVMNFAVNEDSFKPLTIEELFRVSDGAGWQGDRGEVKDKIVLLGGLYPTSRDQHFTPIGSRYGVELLAYAVESDLQKRTVKPPSRYLLLFGELLAGFALVLVHVGLRGKTRALRYTLIAVPLIALLASVLLFSSLALWALFLPVLLAVLIQQLHEDVQGYRKLRVQEIYKETEGLGHDVKKILVDARAKKADKSLSEVDGSVRAESDREKGRRVQRRRRSKRGKR